MQDIKSKSSSEKYCINKFKNIILITLDAFNSELFHNNLHSLPNINKIIKKGVFFTNAFSTGAITQFSFPSIIGSIYPYYYGIKIPENLKTIDYILKERGYNTAFINESQAFLTPYFGYGKNMDYAKYFLDFSNVGARARNRLFVYVQKYIKNNAIKNVWRIIKKYIKFLNLFLFKNYENYKNRKELFEVFLYEIENFINNKFKTPQFLWIHTIVNHLPYLPLNTLTFSEKQINYLNYRGTSQLVNYNIATKLKALFIESLITTDRLIGYIISHLEKNNFLQNSLIIITADHGEEFLEEGYFGHLIQSSSDRLLRVPLIFYSPEHFHNKIISAPVSTIDILPTITDLLNIKKPISAQGISLKHFLFNNLPQKIEDIFWGRPLYSEGWETTNLFDLSPGYESLEKYFTIRLNKYKLIIKQLNNNNVKTEYELTNWVKNKKLDIKKHPALFEELEKLLSIHLTEQILAS